MNNKSPKGDQRCAIGNLFLHHHPLFLHKSISYASGRNFHGGFEHSIDYASKGGHLHIVKWLHTHYPEQCTQRAMDYAASGGYLNIMEWLHTHRNEGCSEVALDFAVAGGHLNVVEWLVAHFPEKDWGGGLINDAARTGHLKLVKWLHTHRTLFRHKDTGRLKSMCSTGAMNYAAMNGHLDIVEWLHTHYNEGCTGFAMERAAMNGHLKVVEWLQMYRKEGDPMTARMRAYDQGHPDIVNWLQKNCPESFTEEALELAAHSGLFMEMVVKKLRKQMEGKSSILWI